MKEIIKKYYRNSKIGFYVLKPLIMAYHFFLMDKYLSQKRYLKKKFKQHRGYDLNLQAPQTLNEKINWLKLNDRSPLMGQLADKYAVRTFIKEKIGEEYLVPLTFTTFKPKDITPKNLPEFPCIIKVNHNSSGGIIVKDKWGGVDWKYIRNTLRWNMSENYYWNGREHQYRNIKPRIIVEKLLQNSEGRIPEDYKLHCFNGKVRMISVDMGRGTDHHHRNWYNTKWEREPYKWSSPKGPGKFTDPSEEDVPKPITLEKMIVLSEIIAKLFDYVRVDWYDVEGKLYFGEITFHHDGGTQPIKPAEWDYKLGSELVLPNHKNN